MPRTMALYAGATTSTAVLARITRPRRPSADDLGFATLNANSPLYRQGRDQETSRRDLGLPPTRLLGGHCRRPADRPVGRTHALGRATRLYDPTLSRRAGVSRHGRVP